MCIRDSYDGLHLVDFDRIDYEVLALETIFLLCLFKAAGCLFDTVVEDVGKSQQNG